jgi:4-amino-4-deoxy-L-arabinose transferase-like glycosyltransferase
MIVYTLHSVFYRPIFLLIIPLSLSGFVHLWNPVGFPDLFSDEGVYMRRALHVLQGSGPQEMETHFDQTYYDHPFFGQLFLAGIFWIVGYPDSLNSSDVQSIEMLFAVPRILMGVLAVIDTFLVFKISQYRYNRNVAFIAAILFAVMPMSWLTRRILLDSILLPFLLTSIFFAVYKIDHTNVLKNKNQQLNYNILLVLLSGICLGLAIFTKIPVFVTIPLVAFLIFTNNKRSLKILGLWFVPVILIPTIWPVYSVAVGHFTDWVDTVLYQANRHGIPFLKTMAELTLIDPVLVVLATAGLIFAILKKEAFILLWAIPNLVYFSAVGWVPNHLFIPLIPLACIAVAVLIINLSGRIKRKNIQKMLPWAVISAIGMFGLVSTTMLITTNVSADQIQVIKFISGYLDNYNTRNENITLVANPIYTWIFKYIYHGDHLLNVIREFDYEPVKTNKVLLITDIEYNLSPQNERLRALYNTTTSLLKFKGLINNFDFWRYPYTSMRANYEAMYGTEVGIGTVSCINYDSLNLTKSVICNSNIN